MTPAIQPSANADEMQSMLEEFEYLIEVECDDEDVQRVTGMKKEELLRVLKEDVGQKNFDLSDDLRGKLESLFSEAEAQEEYDASAVDRTLVGLEDERASTLVEMAEGQGSTVTEARGQMEHAMQIAEQESAEVFAGVEDAEKGVERKKIDAVRQSLQQDPRGNPFSDN
jgi:hypothetical protein